MRYFEFGHIGLHLANPAFGSSSQSVKRCLNGHRALALED
jgi:hypothetical protein